MSQVWKLQSWGNNMGQKSKLFWPMRILRDFGSIKILGKSCFIMIPINDKVVNTLWILLYNDTYQWHRVIETSWTLPDYNTCNCRVISTLDEFCLTIKPINEKVVQHLIVSWGHVILPNFSIIFTFWWVLLMILINDRVIQHLVNSTSLWYLSVTE